MSTIQVHQFTAPRTIQAFLVVLFSIVSCALVLQGQEIPDLIGWTLAGIVGYYFNAKEGDFPFPVQAAGSPPRSGGMGGTTLAEAQAQSSATDALIRSRQSARQVSRPGQRVDGPYSQVRRYGQLRPV